MGYFLLLTEFFLRQGIKYFELGIEISGNFFLYSIILGLYLGGGGYKGGGTPDDDHHRVGEKDQKGYEGGHMR